MTSTKGKNRKAGSPHRSGIAGQAVLEGVMMRNRDLLAIAVRRPDQEIEVEVDEHHSVLEGTIWTRIPLIRGVLALIDALVLSFRCFFFSARFYDESRQGEQADPLQQRRGEWIGTILSTAAAIVLGTGLFMMVPYLVTHLVEGYIRSREFLVLVEALIRIAVFLVFLILVSGMKDVRRIRQYHGAEHKCINCIERGKPLTVNFVRDSSRFHANCDTGFVILVLLVSVILFFLIHIDSRGIRLLVRIALVPAVAGVLYELMRWGECTGGRLGKVLAAPGMWLERFTTREPDVQMIQVGIAAVEAVFDWKAYLADEFGYDRREL